MNNSETKLRTNETTMVALEKFLEQWETAFRRPSADGVAKLARSLSTLMFALDVNMRELAPRLNPILRVVATDERVSTGQKLSNGLLSDVQLGMRAAGLLQRIVASIRVGRSVRRVFNHEQQKVFREIMSMTTSPSSPPPRRP